MCGYRYHSPWVLIGISAIPVHAGDIEGLVRGPNGKPRAGAVVAATPAAPNALSDTGYAAKLVRTDAEGRYRLQGLPRGSYGATATQTTLDLALWPTKGTMPALADELQTMAREDQDIRNRSIDHPGEKAIIAEMVAVDAKNEGRMEEIVKAHGWPDANLVGPRAAGAAWLLVQHGTAPFMKACLPFMKASVEQGDLDWGMVALSIDRDLMHDGKKQLYGSQFRKNDKGEWEPYPIEDEANVDQRRARVGLGTLAEYKAGLIQAYAPKTPSK